MKINVENWNLVIFANSIILYGFWSRTVLLLLDIAMHWWESETSMSKTTCVSHFLSSKNSNMSFLLPTLIPLRTFWGLYWVKFGGNLIKAPNPFILPFDVPFYGPRLIALWAFNAFIILKWGKWRPLNGPYWLDSIETQVSESVNSSKPWNKTMHNTQAMVFPLFQTFGEHKSFRKSLFWWLKRVLRTGKS